VRRISLHTLQRRSRFLDNRCRGIPPAPWNLPAIYPDLNSISHIHHFTDPHLVAQSPHGAPHPLLASGRRLRRCLTEHPLSPSWTTKRQTCPTPRCCCRTTTLDHQVCYSESQQVADPNDLPHVSKTECAYYRAVAIAPSLKSEVSQRPGALSLTTTTLHHTTLRFRL
jgi:hypothetical protein